MSIIRPTTINARFSQPVGLGGEKLWLCPTLGGDRLDLSGNGNHGTYNGGMGTVADKYKGDRAFDLDGVDDYIRTDLKGIRNYESRTVSLWSNLNSVSGIQYFCNWYDDAGGADPRSLFFLIYQNKHTAGHKKGGGSNATILFQGGVPSVGWKHYAFTYDKDSTNAKIYVDGIAVANANISNTAWEADFAEIGRVSIPSSLVYTQQRCDDIRFFDRAITPTEIKHLASYRGVLGSPRQPYDPLKRTVVRVPAAIPAATVVGSIKKPTTISKPSYQAGYARNASESENPNLWDGLVGAWMPSFGVTGETLRDVSGNGNHGTLTNMNAATDWVATYKGLALDYDGSTHYVNLGFQVQDKLIMSQQASFAVWVKPSADQADSGIVANYDGDAANAVRNGIYMRRFASTRIRFGLSDSGGASYIIKDTDTGSCPANQWSHLCGTWDGSLSPDGIKIYINGERSDTTGLTTNTVSSLKYSSEPMTIGRVRFLSSTPSFQGIIAHTSIYNRVLSLSEVKQLYVDSLAPFRRKQRVSVAVPAAVAPSATYHPLRSLAHPLEQ